MVAQKAKARSRDASHDRSPRGTCPLTPVVPVLSASLPSLSCQEAAPVFGGAPEAANGALFVAIDAGVVGYGPRVASFDGRKGVEM